MRWCSPSAAAGELTAVRASVRSTLPPRGTMRLPNIRGPPFVVVAGPVLLVRAGHGHPTSCCHARVTKITRVTQGQCAANLGGRAVGPALFTVVRPGWPAERRRSLPRAPPPTAADRPWPEGGADLRPVIVDGAATLLLLQELLGSHADLLGDT